MGGIGSGRRSFGGSKQAVEECMSIDVNRMRRDGNLEPGHSGRLFWSRAGEPAGDIAWRADADRLVLIFRHRVGGGEWTEIKQPLPVIWTPCRFGGERPWFTCPGVVNGRECGRRVLKVYAGGRYFLCRYCHGLAYHCQSEGRLDRLWRRVDKRRVAMGGERGLLSLPPNKPMGMHWRTYWRRIKEIEGAEHELAKGMRDRFGLRF